MALATIDGAPPMSGARGMAPPLAKLVESLPDLKGSRKVKTDWNPLCRADRRRP